MFLQEREEERGGRLLILWFEEGRRGGGGRGRGRRRYMNWTVDLRSFCTANGECIPGRLKIPSAALVVE